MAFKMKGYSPFTKNDESWWDRTKGKLSRLKEEIVANFDPNKTSLAEMDDASRKKREGGTFFWQKKNKLNTDQIRHRQKIPRNRGESVSDWIKRIGE